ncbi:MAG: HlyD family efflux transporter periplasmic adaptor subunit [Lachnospiraceae bacterium]|nr:HlyD family efflux transporter periplasmic adaptor subunit [Lachnospiraceae bacterium]
MKKIFGSKKKTIIFISIAVALLIIISLIIILTNQNTSEVVYKETSVEKGDLTVGITESGTVTIGTVDQTFDLDLSAFEASQGNSSGSSSGNGGGMGGMFPNMGGNANSSDSSKSYSRALDVEEVYVTAGQQVAKGDPLFRLTNDSVTSIQEELESDEASAELTLAKLQNDQKQSRLSATHTKETSEAYAKLAQNEYLVAVAELQTAMDDKQKEIEDATETVSENQVKLTEKEKELTIAKNVLEHAEYAVETADTAYVYEYGRQEDARDTAKSQVDNLEDEIEDLQDENKQLEDNYQTMLLDLNDLKRKLETGTLEAQKICNERTTTGNDAGEAYAVEVGYLDAALRDAQDDYDDAVNKLTEFQDYIVDDMVYAEYDGVITDVNVAKDDSLSSAQTLITLNNQDDTTITATVDSDDIDNITEDSQINITVDSYPETVFTGSVNDIGDATTNSSTGEITYDVEVLINGDVSGLFEGMTGNVTFITKETKEVLYVSNRAIIRDGIKSYVKIKDEAGTITEQEITTGFSDGVNVEIVEGLSEGDVVLIESKVSE